MDYSVTADYERHHHHQEEDLPAEPEGNFKPVCAQCEHFDLRHASLEGDSWGVCKLRPKREWTGLETWISTYERREVFDPTCDRYVESIPF
jgi:hypothetical protein